MKPKLKRSVAGVGHDAAAEFNEHWWTTLYDKAAANVEVGGRKLTNIINMIVCYSMTSKWLKQANIILWQLLTIR